MELAYTLVKSLSDTEGPGNPPEIPVPGKLVLMPVPVGAVVKTKVELVMETAFDSVDDELTGVSIADDRDSAEDTVVEYPVDSETCIEDELIVSDANEEEFGELKDVEIELGTDV